MEAVKEREGEAAEEPDSDEDEEMEDGEEDDEEEIVEEDEDDAEEQPAQGEHDDAEEAAGPSMATGSRPAPPHAPPDMTEYRDHSPDAEPEDDDSDEGPPLSPISRSRPLSRSPPASRHTSRSPSRRGSSPSLADRTGMDDKRALSALFRFRR